MARKERLPNAHNAWGTLTMTTIGFCNTPILKVTSHIPSSHRYMKARNNGKKRESIGSELYAQIENYADTEIYISKNEIKYGCSRLRKFATALGKKHRAEYLIVTNPEAGTAAASNAKATLTSAGIGGSRIKTVINKSITSDIAYIKVRITL